MKKPQINRKYLEICIYAFALAAAVLVFREILNSLGDLLASLSAGASALWRAISAVIWGAALSYILYPLVRWVDRRPLGWLKKKPKLRRVISIALIYLSLAALVSWAIAFMVPEIIENVKDLWQRIPRYTRQVEMFLNDQELISDWWNSVEVQTWLNNQMAGLITRLENQAEALFMGIVGYVARTVSWVINVALSFMVSFFLLMERESLERSMKRVTLSFLPRERARRVLTGMKQVDSVFGRYIVGKLHGAIILTILAYVGMVIFQVPYSPLMSVVVGFTNLIPYVGPWIGAVPILLVTALDNTGNLLAVAILLVTLQVADNFFITPKVLSDSTGLSPFWVLVSVTVGGSLFGVVGMILGVPVMALIQLFVRSVISRRNQRPPRLEQPSQHPEE